MIYCDNKNKMRSLVDVNKAQYGKYEKTNKQTNKQKTMKV